MTGRKKTETNWIKDAAAFLEAYPLPIADLLADRIRQRDKTRGGLVAVKRQTQRGRHLPAPSLSVKSQESIAKPGVAGSASLSRVDVPAVSRRLSPSERIESSDRTMITSVTEQETMKADKGQFDEVLRRMLAKNPKKTADIKQSKLGFRRKKNPETDPVKLAMAEDEVLVPMKLTAEQREQIRFIDAMNRKYRKKKKH